MLKIALAQLNPTIGDIEGNLALMREAAASAHAAGARLVVYPELVLTGYYPGDLLEEEDFKAKVETGLQSFLRFSLEYPDTHFVVGAPTRTSGHGKNLHNSLLVMKCGQVLLSYHKQLLPTYNVFDERRHFEPGTDVAPVLRIGDARIGFMICEDGWNDAGEDYAVNPFVRLADAAPDLVVSINASPSNLGKREQRFAIFKAASSRRALPILYVNQIGGHDQLIYDGGSFAVDPRRGIVFEAQTFTSDLAVLGFDPQSQCFHSSAGAMLDEQIELRPPEPSAFYHRQIVLGVRDYARRCGFRSVVVGSSGGIDSALTLCLAVDAIGSDHVIAITMPSQYSSAGSVADSDVLCGNLKIPLLTHPIGQLVEAFKHGFSDATGAALVGLSLENLQPRIRGTILMEYSNRFGHLLLNTGNKSEISVGYCTLYGDTNGGLGLIGDLYKSEVFTLCEHLNQRAGRELIPRAIIDKPPSAELAPGQRDTDSLPPYEVLDPILQILIEGKRLTANEYQAARVRVDALSQTIDGRKLIERVHSMVARNEYKRRQAPPILRLRARAFGSGRQMPIAAKY
jgi:NAD+ synthase (glutamine-hydrolysing)